MIELIIVFLIGFFASWFLVKNPVIAFFGSILIVLIYMNVIGISFGLSVNPGAIFGG